MRVKIMLNNFRIYEFNSQSGNRDIASRGSKSVCSEDIVAVKVYGGYVMVVVC